MKKSEAFELRKRVGNFDALFGVKDYVYNDGPARGMRAFDLKNGQGLEMTVLADRGLDIPFLSYKGVNMGFASKTGVRSANLYQENKSRGFLRQFYGGMLTTCGITYSGSPCEEDGQEMGCHGPYSNIPAQGVCVLNEYEGDEAVLRIKGAVREACVFGENMLMERTMTMETESSVVSIRDHLENQGFEAQPVMLIYHINFGYPMLDAGAKVYTNAGKVEPRDEFARSGPGEYNLMEEPGVGRDEQCYFHTDHAEEEGFAMLHNERLGIAGIVSFDRACFPILCEWKCMHAGDYALGLEPTTASVKGRVSAREEGIVPMLGAGEARDFTLRLIFTDDARVIESYKARSREK